MSKFLLNFTIHFYPTLPHSTSCLDFSLSPYLWVAVSCREPVAVVCSWGRGWWKHLSPPSSPVDASHTPSSQSPAGEWGAGLCKAERQRAGRKRGRTGQPAGAAAPASSAAQWPEVEGSSRCNPKCSSCCPAPLFHLSLLGTEFSVSFICCLGLLPSLGGGTDWGLDTVAGRRDRTTSKRLICRVFLCPLV